MDVVCEEEQLFSVLAKEITVQCADRHRPALQSAELNCCSLGVLVGGADKYFRSAISSWELAAVPVAVFDRGTRGCFRYAVSCCSKAGTASVLSTFSAWLARTARRAAV